MSDMANNLHVPLGGWTVPRPTFTRLQVVTPPASLPVDVATLKSHLRITHTSDDTYLAALAGAAVESVERYLGRALINRSLRMWLDFMPGTGNEYTLYGAGTAQVPIRYANIGMFRWIELLTIPVASVSAFKYITNDGTTQTMDPSLYIVDTADQDMPARIVLQRGAVWPVDLQVAHSLHVEYVAGYGTTPDSAPAPLRHAILLMAAALWSNRGDNADQPQDILGFPAVKAILDPYRFRRIGTL